MAKAIQIIEQNLRVIEEKTSEIFQLFHHAYCQYLELLSKSIRRQLVAASYQVCTQIYPEAFLKLSFPERHKLQESLKELTKRLPEQLFSYLENPENSRESPLLESEGGATSESSEGRSLPAVLPAQNGEKKITNPEELGRWYQQVEKGIDETLERLSHQANQCLQQAHILPNRLPTKLLEMALQAENESTTVGSAPNLLDLLVEAEKPESKSDKREREKISRITAIHLRLSEIEFADSSLNLSRNQIRDLEEKLKKIRQQYRQAKKDCAIARAEAAWRSSWLEARELDLFDYPSK